jgi:hypothetical protein
VVYSCLRELALQTGELSAADFDLDEDNFRRAAPESAQEPRDDDDDDEAAPEQPAQSQQQQQQPAQQSAQPSERSFFGFSSSRSAASAGEKDEKAANRLTALEVKAVIQDVVLLGAPVSANSHAWPAIRNLVAGRIVNGKPNPNPLSLTLLTLLTLLTRLLAARPGPRPDLPLPALPPLGLRRDAHRRGGGRGEPRPVRAHRASECPADSQLTLITLTTSLSPPLPFSAH